MSHDASDPEYAGPVDDSLPRWLTERRLSLICWAIAAVLAVAVIYTLVPPRRTSPPPRTLTAKLSAQVVLVDPFYYSEPTAAWSEYRVIDVISPGRNGPTLEEVYRAPWPDGEIGTFSSVYENRTMYTAYGPRHFSSRTAPGNSPATTAGMQATLTKLHRIFDALVDRQLVQDRVKRPRSLPPHVTLEFENDREVLKTLQLPDQQGQPF